MSETVRGRFEIVNALGLHARAANKLVQLASSFPCEVSLVGRDGDPVDGKSVMNVLLLTGAQGSLVEVHARGDRAQDAVDAIGALIRGGFGEDG